MNGHVGVRRDGRTMKSDFPPTPFRSGERENASSVRKYGKTRGAFNYASPAAPLPKKGDVVKTGRTVTASLLLFGSLMFCKNESVRSVRSVRPPVASASARASGEGAQTRTSE